MPIPLLAVAAALASGGSLVPHAAGGLIVSSAAAGGYVGGTYISTAALASFLMGSATAAAVGGLAAVGGAIALGYGTAVGAAMSLVGGAGIFGTTIGASGIVGFMMTRGLFPATPIFVVVGIAAFIILLLLVVGGLLAFRIRRIRCKAISTPDGEEAQFSQREARLVEKLIRSAARPHSWVWRKLMSIFGRRAASRT